MNPAPESIPRTLAVAILVALLCSAMVSGAVHVLRPIQAAYALLERNRTIVEVAFGRADRSDNAVVQAFLSLDARVLDLDSGAYLTALDGHGFDPWADGPEASTTDADGTARGRQVPVYFVTRADAPARLVLPVDGPGMWSTLQGYVGLEADLERIAAIAIYQHGETPGIGDRIEDPAWLDSWRGRRIFDDSGIVRLEVADNPEAGTPVAGNPVAGTPVAGTSDARSDATVASHRVDVITGATITSKALGRLVGTWFGDAGYGPWLADMRRDAALDGARQ